MLFTKKFLTIATVKVGNESAFVEREGIDHFASTKQHSLSEDILCNISASTPPLATDRYSYPQDQHYSLNSSLKLSDNKTLKMIILSRESIEMFTWAFIYFCLPRKSLSLLNHSLFLNTVEN